MFPVNVLADKFDDGDMVARLTASTKAVAEHKSKRSFEHRFISLLKTGLLVEGEDFPGRREFLVGTARKRSICARSIVCGFSFFMRNLRAERAYCARRFPGTHLFERGASSILSASERYSLLRVRVAARFCGWLPPVLRREERRSRAHRCRWRHPAGCSRTSRIDKPPQFPQFS